MTEPSRRTRTLTLAATFAALLLAPLLHAQTPDPPPAQTTTAPAPEPPPPAQTTTTATPATPEPPAAQRNPTPPVFSEGSGGGYERKDALPTLNVYLPEGQASIRLRKLIRNVLFESQIDYRFVTGDISTFLRYKYYAKNFTYRLGVFDEINFQDIGKSGGTTGNSTAATEFQRTRGGLLLFGFPRDYNRRYFFLLQDDRLTFGNTCANPGDPLCTRNVDDKKNNIYTKFGYQYGTQFDERLNGIVGETRGRITPVLTAFRDIGPQKTGLAVALTESTRVSTGDYKYTKLEGEILRRTDITSTSFIFSRLHVGAFLGYDECKFGQLCKGQPYDTTPQEDRFSIPIYEMFKLGGREALKGVDDNKSRGTQEIHLTNEFFVPVFRNRDMRTFQLHWNTMYAIGYVGAGTSGFKSNQLAKSDEAVVDAGLGSEMALSVRDFDVLVSVIYARTVKAPADLEGSKIRFFIRTVR